MLALTCIPSPRKIQLARIKVQKTSPPLSSQLARFNVSPTAKVSTSQSPEEKRFAGTDRKIKIKVKTRTKTNVSPQKINSTFNICNSKDVFVFSRKLSKSLDKPLGI